MPSKWIEDAMTSCTALLTHSSQNCSYDKCTKRPKVKRFEGGKELIWWYSAGSCSSHYLAWVAEDYSTMTPCITSSAKLAYHMIARRMKGKKEAI